MSGSLSCENGRFVRAEIFVVEGRSDTAFAA